MVTFALVGCFWLRCSKLIWAYMGLSGFTILAWLGGSVAVQLIQLWSMPLDVISFSLGLYNFAVVGVLAVFFCRMPIFLTQTYLVIIGAVVAFWFTHLPEWTTWLLLLAMAFYDLVAVLMPGQMERRHTDVTLLSLPLWSLSDIISHGYTLCRGAIKASPRPCHGEE